jgi:hypothetical protein
MRSGGTCFPARGNPHMETVASAVRGAKRRHSEPGRRRGEEPALDFLGPITTAQNLKQTSPSRCLLRSPTHPPVRLGGGPLGRTPRLAAHSAHPRRHPSPRPKKSFQKTWQIKVRIQLGKVKTQARRADLDFIKMRWLGLFQSLRVARRKTYLEPRTEINDNAPSGPVIPRRNRLRNSRPHHEIVSYPNRLGFSRQTAPLTLSRRVILRSKTEN